MQAAHTRPLIQSACKGHEERERGENKEPSEGPCVCRACGLLNMTEEGVVYSLLAPEL